MTTPAPAILALRPREAARALGISVRLLWSLTEPRGPIHCCRAGTGSRTAILYRVVDLDRWLAGIAERREGGVK